MADWRNKQNMPINERVAQIEQWCQDHEERHSREKEEAHETLILAVQNAVALSAASTTPIGAVVKWAASLVALILVAVLGWMLRK